jgi:hypothetical protein
MTEGEALDGIRDRRLGPSQAPRGQAVGYLSPAIPLAAHMADQARQLIFRLTRLDHLFPLDGENDYQLGEAVLHLQERVPPGWVLGSLFCSDGEGEGFPCTDTADWSEWNLTYSGFLACYGPGPIGARPEIPIWAEIHMNVEGGWWELELHLTDSHLLAMVELGKRAEHQLPEAPRGGTA